MGNLRLISDLHLGDKHITTKRTLMDGTPIRQYEHDNIIIDNILTTCSRRDKLIIAGDVCFDMKSFESHFKQLVHYLPNTLIVPGNHDFENNKRPTLKHYCDLNVKVKAYHYQSKFIISHIPIHYNQFRDRIGNIHGHVHDRECDYGEDSWRYFNISAESKICQLKPVTINDIRDLYEERLALNV